MATVTKFEDLDIWMSARKQADEIYKLTKKEPFAKDFELKNQINRSAGSAMDNIAEGFDRFTNKEFSQFLVISKGSNSEVRSQLYRAFDREYIDAETLNLRQDYSRILGNKIKSLIDYLKNSKYKTKPTGNKKNMVAGAGQTSNLQLPTSN